MATSLQGNTGTTTQVIESKNPLGSDSPTMRVMPIMKAAGPDSKVNMSVECWRPDSGHRVVVDEDKEQFSRGELRLIGQGAEAEIFEWQDGRVLKLLRARGQVERVEYEVAARRGAFRGLASTTGL